MSTNEGIAENSILEDTPSVSVVMIQYEFKYVVEQGTMGREKVVKVRDALLLCLVMAVLWKLFAVCIGRYGTK